MSGFDRLGQELESAAQRRREPWWARHPRHAGGTAVIVAGLATVAVIAVAAVALLHGRTASSPIGSATPTAAAQPAPAAQAAAWARLLKCAPAGKRPRTVPATTNAAPSSAIVSALGVLRAPWVPADEVPAGARCQASLTSLLSGKVDIRYVRYIGPGVHGGEVYLVPIEHIVPKLRGLTAYAPLPHDALESACLFTVGSRSSSSSVQGCTLLVEIERPASAAVAPLPFTPPSRAVLRRLCEHEEGLDATERKKCLAEAKKITRRTIAAPSQVIAGVVRDGITSVDVYASGKHASRLLLANVPIHDNVYTFQSGGAVTGLLSLVFKSASGQTVQTTPTETGTVNTSNSLVGTGSAHTGTVEGKAGTGPPPVGILAPTQTITGVSRVAP
jgi:hypothetical protein